MPQVQRGYKGYLLPSSETISERGMTVPPSMGTAIALNFQPTGGGKAAAPAFGLCVRTLFVP